MSNQYEKICPICGSDNIIEVDGNLVCGDCGYVLDEAAISLEFETRFFDAQEFRLKARAPPPREDFDADLPRIRLKVANKNEKYVIPISARERTMKSMLNYLDDIFIRINAPESAKKEARRLIKEFVLKKKGKVKNLRNVTAAILFMALRITGNPRPLDSYVKAVYPEKEFLKAKREFGKALNVVKKILGTKYNVRREDVERLITYMARELKLSGKCLIFALDVYKKLKDRKNFIGVDPSSLAAAIIYVSAKALGENRSPNVIAELASITKTTLKNKGKEIEAFLKTI